MYSGLDRLSSIITCLDDGHLTDEVCSMMRRGFNQYISGECSLEVALGLNGTAGGRKPTTQFRKMRRNHFLLQAWKNVAGTEIKHPWERSKLLHKAINRFQVGRWRVWREYDSPPTKEPLIEAMFYAFKTGDGIPQTAQGIHDCIERALKISDG